MDTCPTRREANPVTPSIYFEVVHICNGLSWCPSCSHACLQYTKYYQLQDQLQGFCRVFLHWEGRTRSQVSKTYCLACVLFSASTMDPQQLLHMCELPEHCWRDSTKTGSKRKGKVGNLERYWIVGTVKYCKAIDCMLNQLRVIFHTSAQCHVWWLT